MAKGWQGIEDQTQATQAAREGAGGFLPELKIGAKEWQKGPFQIRFLEQGADVNNFPVHEYKEPGNNPAMPFHKKFTCLGEVGQQCPGCEAGMKVKRRGVYNLIQRNRPVFRKDKDGKSMKDSNGNYIIDGHRDEVVVANVGGPTAEMLRKADGDYKGLMCRDFTVTYTGDSFQGWNLTVAMDAAGNSSPTPMSDADQALAASKHDLDAYMRPKSYQEAAQIVARYVTGGVPTHGQPQGAPQPSPAAGNQFLAGAPLPGGTNVLGGAFAPPPAPTPTQ